MEITSRDEFTALMERSKETPVLIDVYAPWCAPCKSMMPVVNELAEAVGDQAVVAKINADDMYELVEELGVRSLPTFMVFRDSEVKHRQVGILTRHQLSDMLF